MSLHQSLRLLVTTSLLTAPALPQGVCWNDLAHRAEGNAEVSVTPDERLRVSNLGSSGLDGVRTMLPPPEPGAALLQHGVLLGPIDPQGALPTGAGLTFTTLGQLHGVPDSDVGSLRVEKLASGEISYTPDFSALGATSYLFEVYDGGALVLSVTVGQGTSAKAGGWFDCLARGCPPDDWDPTWPFGVAITIEGQAPVVGDRMRMRAQGVQSPPESLSATRILANDIPSLELTGEFASGFDAAGSCESLGTPYCTGALNSAGTSATMHAEGSLSVADGDLTLVTEGVVPGVPGLYFFGANQIQAPFGDGFRCVAGSTLRILPPGFADGLGVMTRSLDFGASYAAGFAPGTDVNFQLWYRDTMAGMSGFNLSNGLNVVFL